MFSLTRSLLAAALAAALPAAAQAMTFEPSLNGETIFARGEIGPKDADTLRQLLDTDSRYRFALARGDGITLDLHSPGGSVVGGIELANLVRTRGLRTRVGPDSACASACTFVFIGGVRRTMEGRFGIHAMSKDAKSVVVYSDGDVDAIQRLASTLLNLASTLIGDSRMISNMLTVPGASIRLVTDAELAEWRIITHAARPAQRMKASFDCGGSSLTEVERAVCDHLVLAESDRRMAAALEWLIGSKAAPDLEAEQQRWVKYRDSCRHVPGPTADFGLLNCITEAYAVRLQQLEGLKAFHEAAARGPAAAGWKEHGPIRDILMIQSK